MADHANESRTGGQVVPPVEVPAMNRAWRHAPGAEDWRPVVERFAALVYSSAYRRTGRADQAEEVTRAVFLVLARRARKLPRKTVLAGWLFHVTALACRKRLGKARRAGWWRWFRRRPRSEPPPEATLWSRVAPEFEPALDRLPASQRDAVVLRVLLNQDGEAVARTLRTSARRAGRRADRGWRTLTGRLRRRGVAAEAEALARVCSAEGCAVPLPEGLIEGLLEATATAAGRRPALKLARRTLNALAWARWRRRGVIGCPIFVLVMALIAGVAWHLDARSGHSRFFSTLWIWSLRLQVLADRGLAGTARPWPSTAATPRLEASRVRGAQDLYRGTNIWRAHLSFTRQQWQALEPKHIGVLPNFRRPDGMLLLRNPAAKRSGLAGVLGYEFPWTDAAFELGGAVFTNVAVRYKGNVGSLYGTKRSFKVDLNRFAKGQKLGGLDELALNNLFWDYSCLKDALGYEFFRDAGVAAPRTAYAWLSVSVAGQWDRKPLGLYVMVEPVDKAFVAERFGSKKTPVFKPVSYNLFEYLGDDWSAYAGIYDLKTQATPEQLRHVIEFTRLLSSAPEADFAARVGDFLDLDQLARFLAGQVLLSNYDSLLADGQNFYMYLDPRSNRFGFIPWDLDASWGEFWLASKEEMERASIWHPWVGPNRFLERVMAVEAFRRLYRAHLEEFLAGLFVPQRLQRRIAEMAVLLREPIAAESAFRLHKFEQSVGAKPLQPSPREYPYGLNHPAHQLQRFVEARARSVRRQLEGKSAGMILKPPAER